MSESRTAMETNSAPPAKFSLTAAASLIFPEGTTVFSSHSHLQLDASRLQEILTALIASNNAHELQIQELQQQLRPRTSVDPLSPESQPPLLSAAFDSPKKNPIPVIPAVSPPVRDRKKKSAVTDESGSAFHSAEHSTLVHDVGLIRRVLGLDTAVGRSICESLTPSSSAAADQNSSSASSPPSTPVSAYDVVADLPFSAAILRRVNRTSPAVSSAAAKALPSSGVTADMDALPVVVRGLESQIELLTHSVEHLKQQVAVSAPASKVTMSTSKAAVIQRAPSPALVQSVGAGGSRSSEGSGAVDAVARVDIARQAQEILLLQSRVDALGQAAAQQGCASGQAGLVSTQSTLAKDWSLIIANIVKRIEVLESDYEAPAPLQQRSTGSPQQRPAPVAAAVAASPAFDERLKQVEDRLQEALRLSKEAVTKSVHSHMETVAAALERLRDWTHARLQPLEQSVQRFASVETSLLHQKRDTSVSSTSSHTPIKPTTCQLQSSHDGEAAAAATNELPFSHAALSPFAPKREAVVRAASSNPRGKIGVPGATVAHQDAEHRDTPQSALVPSLVFKLGSPSGGTQAPVLQRSASVVSPAALKQMAPRPASEMGFHLSSQVTQRDSPREPTLQKGPAHHDPATCVVWRCTWCAQAQSQRSGWTRTGVSPPVPAVK